MTANPNPCFIPAGQTTCTSKIEWKAYTSLPVKVLVRETGGLFASGPFGSQNAPWINATPIHFDLYAGNAVVTSIEVQGSTTPTNNLRIKASPNPCTITSGNICTSTISWNYDGNVEIRIKENPGSIFAKAPSGSQAAPWITTDGATFQVFSSNTLLEELFVQGIPSGTTPSASPSPSPRRISAAPNPCNLNGAPTCSSAITWSYDSVVEIRIKENPGSLFAKSKSGTQVAPWISSSGATFQAYLNNNLIDELFVSGIGPSISPSASPTASASPSASGSSKTGDLNNDGEIDALDYNIFLADYQNSNLRSDINNDGVVDVLDYNILLQNFSI